MKHDNIYAALSALQGELKPFAKSAKVEFEKKSGGKVEFNYTPLGEIMEALYPMLGKHGLTARHEIVKVDAKDNIVAVLTHETYKRVPPLLKVTKETDGREITETVQEGYVENELRSGPIRVFQGDDMKDIGAAITYARRYSLTMMLGIASEDDTDAQLFMERAEKAIDFAYGKAETGLKNAKTAAEVDKAIGVLKKDLELVEKGKAGALGLSKEQYGELIKLGEARKVEIEKGNGEGK